MINIIKDILGKKFVKDSIWNILSTVVLGISGILINIIIGNFFQAGGLGLFSQSLAAYMIISLWAIFGIQVSITRSSAEWIYNKVKLDESITSALFLVIIISFFVVFLTIVLLRYSDLSFKNQQINTLVQYMSPGLIFFSINKVLLGFINGLRKMKFYAVTQSIRWIILLLLTFIISSYSRNLSFVVISFPLTEVIIFIVLISQSKKFFEFRFTQVLSRMKEHLFFGGKSVLTESLSEVNSQVTVLLIGYFLTDQDAGNYSLAFNIARGFLMITAIIQLNFNPIIANLWAKHRLSELEDLFHKIRKTSIMFMLPVLFLAALIYPVFIQFFMKNPSSYHPSILMFFILLIGIGVISPFYSVGAIFTMTGYPGEQFKIMLIIFFINICMNIVLIQKFKVIGAAISTSALYVLSTVLLILFVKKKLGIHLVT